MAISSRIHDTEEITMARPASKFAHIKSPEQRDELIAMWKTDSHHYTRMRAHAVLLSCEGFDVSTLVRIFSVDRDSVVSWIDRFESGGVEALRDADRPGGPPKLNEEDQKTLKDLFRQFPHRPSMVRAELEKRTGKQVSETTLRDYARRLNLRWKRLRRSLRKKRDERAFELAREELAELLKEPGLDVVYFDEAGLSLKGVVPYGWQPVAERFEISVTGAHGSTIQALGLQHQDGRVDSYLHKGFVNSETVIAVLDDYSSRIERPTVVVLDNAPSHTSGAFCDALARWAERGLMIYHLPPYSPELNAIECFWKKLKYQLLPITAWERFTTLLTNVTAALCSVGETTYMPSLQAYTE
jgi:transposase